MTVFIGADHRGFTLKEHLKDYLTQQGVVVEDKGDTSLQPTDDYTDYSAAVAHAVAATPESRGIVICGSGAGVGIAANKVASIRCSLGFDPEQVRSSRADDDINVLALPADFLTPEKAEALVDIFLATPFSGEERHQRRLAKLEELEAHG